MIVCLFSVCVCVLLYCVCGCVCLRNACVRERLPVRHSLPAVKESPDLDFIQGAGDVFYFVDSVLFMWVAWQTFDIQVCVVL